MILTMRPPTVRPQRRGTPARLWVSQSRGLCRPALALARRLFRQWLKSRSAVAVCGVGRVCLGQRRSSPDRRSSPNIRDFGQERGYPQIINAVLGVRECGRLEAASQSRRTRTWRRGHRNRAALKVALNRQGKVAVLRASAGSSAIRSVVTTLARAAKSRKAARYTGVRISPSPLQVV
jgi:hypothetical protein